VCAGQAPAAVLVASGITGVTTSILMGTKRDEWREVRDILTIDTSEWLRAPPFHPARMFGLGVTAGAFVAAVVGQSMDINPWYLVPPVGVGALGLVGDLRRWRATRAAGRQRSEDPVAGV
jgi:hypothetical protein